MIHALRRRLLRLEQAARASDAVKVVIRPVGLDGDALAEWDLVDPGLVVVLNKFSETDAPPAAAEPDASAGGSVWRGEPCLPVT
jgi:hypothetical protein